MKTIGLITEYNPFHNGHAWHMQEAKRLSGADFCVVVMSGNFVQRGAPAILDKYARAEMALACGADLVLELPSAYALGSAEYFASGAVSLLDGLGVVDSLCFGSECGDISALAGAAQILAEEPEAYVSLLKKKLKEGKTFPLARAEALEEYIKKEIPGKDSGSYRYFPEKTEFYAEILKEPNNLLGIEYLKALTRLKSRIVPFTIPRAGGAYHSDVPDERFSSATALRKLLVNTEKASGWEDLQLSSAPAREPPSPGQSPLASLEAGMPPAAYPILERELGKSCPVYSQDFSLLLHYRLLSVSSPEALLRFQDISSELADRIYRKIPEYRDFEQFTALVKTRQYTESRVRRCLLHILLGILAEDVAYRKSHGWNGYARVLGFRRDSSALLREIKEKSRLPLITKLTTAKNVLSPEEMHFLEKDIYVSQVYQSVVTGKFGGKAYSEYRRPLVIHQAKK